ncbi:hypothetical protein LQE85_02560 [Stenotrophomonas rhizophila]|uniref:hypothetical protein n=1 Tax=Stenotrophomonas rhizophila TaxID=216778 RepID=UPI00201CBF44|nr:hypothetical protein [Stenotrophomonas rhizophila]UQY88136.1 hypothetical protein LQE85_02560 [Stenotrophomonas rhizophila]
MDDLLLDPTNPRLGRRIASKSLKQNEILEVMKDWSPEELAVSFIESGFWPQEALILVKETIYRKKGLVVVEGNRRLAALKLLKSAIDGQPISAKWKELAASSNLPKGFFSEIPYIEVENRAEVSAYLGFRHVTGIKEWKPAEKAEYIAKLIEEEGLTYDQVRKKIGSKVPAVRQHYIAYRLLLQMDQQEEIDMDFVEVKFSVLYLSLRTQGVQSYLGVDLQAEPAATKNPVKRANIGRLVNYATWLFGNEKTTPLFSDSRYVDEFGKILENDDAIEYLERTKSPRFDVARRKAGTAVDDVVTYVLAASDSIQLSLTEAHVFRKDPELNKAVRRLAQDSMQLVRVFPNILKEVISELSEDASAS